MITAPSGERRGKGRQGTGKAGAPCSPKGALTGPEGEMYVTSRARCSPADSMRAVRV